MKSTQTPFYNSHDLCLYQDGCEYHGDTLNEVLSSLSQLTQMCPSNSFLRSIIKLNGNLHSIKISIKSPFHRFTSQREGQSLTQIVEQAISDIQEQLSHWRRVRFDEVPELDAESTGNVSNIRSINNDQQILTHQSQQYAV